MLTKQSIKVTLVADVAVCGCIKAHNDNMMNKANFNNKRGNAKPRDLTR